MQTFNKRADFDYQLFDRVEVGLVLSGGEAKAVRTGHADISRSFAKIIGGEVFLVNANIPIVGKKDYDSTHSRKLLLHKKEILSLETQMKAQKLTLVPTKLYTKGRLVKLELALAKAKREFDKRKTLKQKDIQRDIDRELRIKE
jgi:SsrA-binding protein